MPRFVRPRAARNVDEDWVDPRRKKDHRAERPSLLSAAAHVGHTLTTAASAPVDPPALLLPLKEYQKHGICSLVRLLRSPIRAAVLGDEMGLGKTAQGIGVFEAMRTTQQAEGRKTTALIIAPLTVVPAWVAEFLKFCGSERSVVSYAGPRELRDSFVDRCNSVDASGRTGAWPLPDGVDVVVATPESLLADEFLLAHLDFDLMIFDEAHRLRASRGKLGELVRDRMPHVKCRLLMTGTPFHNAAIEFYTLLRTAAPKWLPEVDPVELETAAGKKELKTLGSLLMIRRLKVDVLRDLPPLTEINVTVPMSPRQHSVYKSLLRKQFSTTSLHNLVLQLRKCANHPYMFAGVEPEPFEVGEHLVTTSGKMVVLDCLLRQLIESGHRVLIFSQFTGMLDILQDYLDWKDIRHARLDGSVRGEDRAGVVRDFQTDDDACVMLLSTRAGGVGITLTAADTVIIFDSDWNPQMDRQAMQRVHRVGQEKHVRVIRLISGETVDDVIVARAGVKAKNAAATLEEATFEPVHESDLSELLTAAAATQSEPSAEEWNLTVRSLTQSLQLEQVLSSSAPATVERSEEHAVSTMSVYQYNGRSYAEMVKAGAAAAPSLMEQSKTDVCHRHRGEVPVEEWSSDDLKRQPISERPSSQERRSRRRERRNALTRRWEAKGFSSTALPSDDEDDEEEDADVLDDTADVQHVSGSVLELPASKVADIGSQVRFCVVPVNNGGRWGHGGLFRAVDAACGTSVGKHYERAKELGDLPMGSVHCFPHPTISDAFVLLAVVQRSASATHRTGGETTATALAMACRRMRNHARSYVRRGGVSSVAIFFPGLGSKADTYALEKLLQRHGASLPAPKNSPHARIPFQLVRCHVRAGGAARADAPASAPKALLPRRLEQPFEESAFAFHAFDQTPAQLQLLHELQRLVLMYGGVVVAVPEELDPATQVVIVIPDRASDVSPHVVGLHEAGALVVDPSWVFRHTGAA